MTAVLHWNDYFSCNANVWVIINALIIIYQNQSPADFNQIISSGTFVSNCPWQCLICGFVWIYTINWVKYWNRALHPVWLPKTNVKDHKLITVLSVNSNKQLKWVCRKWLITPIAMYMQCNAILFWLKVNSDLHYINLLNHMGSNWTISKKQMWII